MFLNLPFSEWLGYAASVFVGISLLMGDMRRLRVINLIGCVLFTVYGLIIGAYPVAAMNLFGAAVNIYHLTRLRSAKAVS
ncbi:MULTISPECIES: YgjV family protein [Deinococcus]|uniref:YgjV family protein n=1 Tax=Deinococcus TaxID=1298 RepID=UPI000674F6FD